MDDAFLTAHLLLVKFASLLQTELNTIYGVIVSISKNFIIKVVKPSLLVHIL